jgi:16S rRNA processing protein RimM
LNDLACYNRLHKVAILRAEGYAESYRIEHVRRAGDRLILQIEGCGSIDTVRALVGLEFSVRRDELPPPAEGEFYWADLEGLMVYTEEGDCLGRVEEFFPTGSNEVLVVRQGSQETLLPFIKDIIIAIDGTGGTMHIRALPGLL